MSEVDPSGEVVPAIVAIGAAIGGVTGAIQAANQNGGWTQQNAGKIFTGALLGAVTGGVPGFVSVRLGLKAAVAAGGVASGYNNIAGQLSSNDPFDPCQVVIQTTIGAVGGWAGWRLGLGYKNSPILGPTGALGYLYNNNPATAVARPWTVGQAMTYGQIFGAVAAGGTVAGLNAPVPTALGGLSPMGKSCGCSF